jgi:hypothetical protein
MTYGDRIDAVVRHSGAAEPLDTAVRRLASALDPIGTDASGEAVEDRIRDRFRTVLADLAVREGWKLP